MNHRISTISACLVLSAFASQSAYAYESWSQHFNCTGTAGASLQVRYRTDLKIFPSPLTLMNHSITGYAFYSPDGNFRVKKVTVSVGTALVGRGKPKDHFYGGTNKAVNTNVSGVLSPGYAKGTAYVSLDDLKGKKCSGSISW